jgi:hypothetical protein
MKKKETKPPKGAKEEKPWERFQRLAKGVVAVPKEAIREPKDKPPQST